MHIVLKIRRIHMQRTIWIFTMTFSLCVKFHHFNHHAYSCHQLQMIHNAKIPVDIMSCEYNEAEIEVMWKNRYFLFP